MSYRRLFYARDKNLNVIHIDMLSQKEGTYFCPFCKERVSPRMGDKRVWHFAHIGNTCSNLSEENSGEDADLLEMTMDIPVLDQVEVPQDCKAYLCPLCNQTGAKDYGVKWKGSIFICKECYGSLDGNVLEKLG